MPLSLSELKDRAIRFAQEWAGETDERASAQSFWVDFFQVFDVKRRRVASFEVPIKKLGGKQGFADLLWKGTLLVEHKSRGRDLDKAFAQAKDYFPGLQDYELPKYILVSDFARFRLHDLEEGTQHEFTLSELHQHLHLFSFITGYQKRQYPAEDPANIEAAELMGKLHDQLLANGYTGHKLEVLLVRILFCLFAEDTAIFEKDAFRVLLEEHTREDGSDVGGQLAQWFSVLDQPEGQRQRTLPDYLRALPYVNGSLFTEFFAFPAFDAALRQRLIRCTYFDWSRISPAIFGSLFQSVTDPVKRRNLGAHYTSETNILKVIQGLFLDELRQELAAAGLNRPRLDALHRRLERIRFLDPSCGCGNFLVVTYRELRLLELEILKRQYRRENAPQTVNLNLFARVQVDQAYGIEVEEFPARIAEVAMWLMDHQLNLRLSETFGELYVRLPLTRTAKIVHGNALLVEWNDVLNLRGSNTLAARQPGSQAARQPGSQAARQPGSQAARQPGSLSADAGEVYVLGNPPFIGSKLMSEQQRRELLTIAGGKLQGAGVLDYVAAWYLKAAQLIQGSNIKVALVSTNSITQGEQVSILWGEMLNRYGIHIHFAHRTFKWSNEARGNANVYCVIIGFGQEMPPTRRLFDYATPKALPQELKVNNINPYLVDAENVLATKRSKPLSNVSDMLFGNMPNDGGYLFLTDFERQELIDKEPDSSKFIRPFLGAVEFINNIPRWCLWLVDIKPSDLKRFQFIRERVEAVRQLRQSSKREATRKLGDYPQLFGEIRQPETEYLLVPRHSSESRRYVPVGFFSSDIIVGDSCMCIPDATPYLFGIITSTMHMAWMRQICGRIKSDFRYSGTLVYNNFPFPTSPTPKQTAAVEAAAQQVLAARAQFPGESLAALYDPLTMPPALVKAHQQLDKAVDACYRPAAFPTELSRLEFLFEQYRQLQAPLLPAPKKAPRKSRSAL